jgi:type VI secretion system FHA domain protein
VSSNWTVDQAEVAPPIDPGKFSSQRLRPESSGAGALGQSFEPPAPKLEPPRVRGETPAEDIWTRHLAAIQTTPAAPAASAPQLVSARRTPEPSLASPTPASEPEPGLAPAPAMDTRAEELLRACIAGLRKLVEARARAKAELGAQTTVMDLHGNNPLKFAVTADAALAQMLQPPQRGFLDGPAAVDDAFNDIQAHQLATIAAMRDALRATIDRFSPAAIRGRVKKGFLDSLLPDARNAALWKAYEAEFEGVVKGSDEAFMDVFSREFLRAYEEAAHFSRRR